MKDLPKTLKDLPGHVTWTQIAMGKNNCVMIKELREEAIKWIKEWQFCIDKLMSAETKKMDRLVEGKISGFKQFFNISEEDLKCLKN